MIPSLPSGALPGFAWPIALILNPITARPLSTLRAINGQTASHVFTIRYTKIEFDTRHRVRDALGNLYRILSVDNVDLQNRWLRINALMTGDEDREAAR